MRAGNPLRNRSVIGARSNPDDMMNGDSVARAAGAGSRTSICGSWARASAGAAAIARVSATRDRAFTSSEPAARAQEDVHGLARLRQGLRDVYPEQAEVHARADVGAEGAER